MCATWGNRAVVASGVAWRIWELGMRVTVTYYSCIMFFLTFIIFFSFFFFLHFKLMSICCFFLLSFLPTFVSVDVFGFCLYSNCLCVQIASGSFLFFCSVHQSCFAIKDFDFERLSLYGRVAWRNPFGGCIITPPIVREYYNICNHVYFLSSSGWIGDFYTWINEMNGVWGHDYAL